MTVASACSVQFFGRVFPCRFINVNWYCYCPENALESHHLLHESGILQNPHHGLFCSFSPAFLRFLGRKNKKLGLLEVKVRRFCIESTDVLPQEVRCFGQIIRHFPHLLPCFRWNLPNIARISSIIWKMSVLKLTAKYCKTCKNTSKFTLKAMPKFVKIFEGFRSVSVCFFIPSSTGLDRSVQFTSALGIVFVSVGICICNDVSMWKSPAKTFHAVSQFS